MDDWTGRVLSKVRIEKLIGHGGMADVYVGRHTTLNRPMAVKILHPHMTVNADLRRRFRDEAQAVAALRHPNIVQVIDFDVVDDRPYIVMELLEGMPLNEYLRGLHGMGHTLPLEAISRMMTSLTSALDYAHNQQIVHRDVKPANIILRAGETPIKPNMPLPPDAEPILTDFGVARIATSTTPTASGTILGTPAYMSPEQVRGEAVDRRSDIYALGIILYELLAGKLPFNPETDTPASILYKHVHEDPPVVPNVSPTIQRVVEKSLAKDKDARYQEAGQMAADLRSATGTTPAASAPAVTIAATPRAPEATAPTTQAEKEGFRPSILLIAGIAVGAVVLVGGAVLGSQLVGGDPIEPIAAATSTPAESGAINEPAEPTPEEVEVVSTIPVPTEAVTSPLEPVSAAILRDGGLELQIPNVAQPPDGMSYHAWLLDSESLEPLHLNLEGAVDFVGGELLITYEHPEETNLLADYSKVGISLEEEGSVLTQPSTLVFEGSVDPATSDLVRLAHNEKRGDAILFNLRDWLPVQVGHFMTHSGFALDGMERDDLPYIKTHSEHSLNIVEGVSGELFRDWDGNGAAENPGDNVGVVPYLLLLESASKGGARAELLRGGTGELGIQLADTTAEVIDLISDIRETMRQILLVDTAADISSFGLDSDLQLQREIQQLVELLVANSEAVDLVFAIDIFPAK